MTEALTQQQTIIGSEIQNPEKRMNRQAPEQNCKSCPRF